MLFLFFMSGIYRPFIKWRNFLQSCRLYFKQESEGSRLNTLRRMLAGRYGPDQLGIVLTVLSFLLSLVGQLLQWSPLLFLSWLVLFFAFYRMFSHKIDLRRRENDRLMVLWNTMAQRFRQAKARRADKKIHRYYHCPQCNQTLRVPKGRGKIKITCPKCGTQFVKKT